MRRSTPFIKGNSQLISCASLRSLGSSVAPHLLISPAIGTSLQIPEDTLSWRSGLHTEALQSCSWFVLYDMYTLPIQREILKKKITKISQSLC